MIHKQILMIIPYVFTCIDPSALNYNYLANTDDGTCIAVIEGCTVSIP